MTDNPTKSLTPNLPIYSNARHFLRTIAGSTAALYHSMSNAIWEQRGNPQANASWTDPDTWIPQRLSGDEQALAMRFWNESRHSLNPRHLRGCWYLATRHQLLETHERGTLAISERGKEFLAKPDSPSVAEIDSYEGILTILQLVAERGPGWRSDFLPDFATYCRTFTSFHSDNAIKGALYDRLFNLIERGAAPITLIDGEKLLDLLRQHEIGVSKKAVEYFEFDSTKLVQFEPSEADEPDA